MRYLDYLFPGQDRYLKLKQLKLNLELKQRAFYDRKALLLSSSCLPLLCVQNIWFTADVMFDGLLTCKRSWEAKDFKGNVYR